MSISNEISRINHNIASAYDALDAKGASMPQSRNSENLSATVNSLEPVSGKMDLMPTVTTEAQRQALPNGQLFKYQSECGITYEDSDSGYILLAKKSDLSIIPTAVSQLQNDSGFQNASQVAATAESVASSAVNAVPTLTLQITYDDDTTATVNLLTRAAS